jgi:hypothetical protein
MTGACEIPSEQLCDCCVGLAQETPQAIVNRPALPAIAYRTGTYATFNSSMLAALSSPAYLPLGALRTRDSCDFSIALIDAWAVALDILTFYQERFANEAFVRTALDQRSTIELARLVGYVPSPGVAASAVLAFTLSDAPGSPDDVLIPAGTRVQSVPGPGQKPQVFETSADLTAVIAGNAIPVQTTLPWQLSIGDTSAWIAGTSNNINVGDGLLFVGASNDQPSTGGPADFRYVRSAITDPVSGNTQIFWDAPLSTVAGNANQAWLYVFRKKAALFGVQAPNPALLPQLNITTDDATDDWSFVYDGNGVINLDASYSGLTPAGTSPTGQPAQLQWLVLTSPDVTAYLQISAASESNPNRYALSAKTSRLTLSTAAVIAGQLPKEFEKPILGFTEAANVTAAAQFVRAGSPSTIGAVITEFHHRRFVNRVLGYFVDQTRSTTAYMQSSLLTPVAQPITIWTAATTYPLAAGMIVPIQGNAVSVVGGQQIVAAQPIGVSGKRVRLQVLASAKATFTPAGSSASMKVTDNQVFLVDAYPPTRPTDGAAPLWNVLTTSNITGALAVADDHVELLPADKKDPAASEASLVSTVDVAGGVTTLSLKSALARIYDATTVRINANALEATHGETVQEILGSGDATNDALQFTLKQTPLTYVSAATGNGTQSTLQVWINNLQWHEVPNLLSSGPADRVFITRVSAAGNTVVQFGNGVQGARPPTGQSNIRAVYRKGIGSAGMVSAGQLSQPLDRPQGLKAAVNPSAASGASDPASAAAIRASAPLPTLTLGRVVSLEDYQNFALAFAGVSKALATWTWFGSVRGVFLTIAGANGATLQADDPVVGNLIQAMHAAGDPYVPLQVASFVPLLFQCSTQVRVDQTNYDATQVLAQVWQNLNAAFAFDARSLAQSVVAGDIVEIIQQTPGVVALQLQALHLSGEAPGAVPAMLCAAGPDPPKGAQMLLLDPATQGAIGVWA